MADSQLLTIKDVIGITKLGRTMIYEQIRDGELPAVRIGRTVRIRREAAESFTAEREDVLELTTRK